MHESAEVLSASSAMYVAGDSGPRRHLLLSSPAITQVE